MSNLAAISSAAVSAGKTELSPHKNETLPSAQPAVSGEPAAAAKRGRKPGSTIVKKKPSSAQTVTHFFQLEKGFTPGSGKPPVVIKDFKDESEAYRACFKSGSLCIRGEVFSIDIVGKTLTEVPVMTAAQPE